MASARSGINVDGKLDDPDWTRASSIGEIVQREPLPGEQASERTEVKLLRDTQNLYIGVVCHDSAPDRVIGTQMARDADLSADDRIEIVLDTFHDRHNAYYFATNPAGSLVDGLVIQNGNLNVQWDGLWLVRTRRGPFGWSAEFAIPFKTLSFAAGQAWGFNVSRTIQRKLEEDRWAAPRLDVSFLQVSEAGELDGLEGIEQGFGLDLRPYASMGWSQAGEPGTPPGVNQSLTRGKGGADLFYRIKPGLRLTATLNTDFAEAEVDERRTNLTRFPIFFPEKRPFFLEDAGVFEFGSSLTGNTEIVPFFSRRIGLYQGLQVPLRGGVRLTGSAERWNLGVLGVRTDDPLGTGTLDFAVARVRRNLFQQSSLGVILTDGSPNGSPARTYGGDLDLATSHFLGRDRNFGVQAFALQSQNGRVRGPDAAFGAAVRYPNDLWNALLAWRQLESAFDPALGFVERTGVRRTDFAAEYDPRPSHFLHVRQMFHEFSYRRITRLDTDQVEGWRIFTAPINWQFESGDRVEVNYIPYFERVFSGETEEVGPGVFVPPGAYRFTRGRLEFATAQKRRMVVEGTWWFGEFWSGHADQIEAAIEGKLAPHFLARLSLDEAFGSLPEGRFTVRVLGLRADWSMSPFLGVFNLLQYDSESRTLGLQSRARWILHPGNDLFVVVSQGRLQDPGGGLRFHSTDTHVTLKTQYTFRF